MLFTSHPILPLCANRGEDKVGDGDGGGCGLLIHSRISQCQ